MDGNQGPEMVPAGHGAAGLSRAGRGAAPGPGTVETALADAARMLASVRPARDSAAIIDRIRHLDHIVPWHDGGLTTAANGAGLCEACNHTKETPGWTARPAADPGSASGSGDRHTIKLTTPTGHTYYSTAPPLPGTPRRQSAAAQPGSQPGSRQRRQLRHKAKTLKRGTFKEKGGRLKETTAA